MHKTIRYVILIIILVACQDTDSNAENVSQVTLDPTITIPDRYLTEVIEIGPFAENFLIADDNIWIIKQWMSQSDPGGLIRMSLEEPYKQQFYELPDSLGGDHMVFDGQHIWVTRNRLSEESFLVKFDPRIGQIIGQYSVNASGDLASITLSTNTVWVSDPFNGQLLKLDMLSGSIIGRLEPDYVPDQIAFADNKLWILSSFQAKVAVHDALTDQHLVTYSLENYPSNIVFDNEKAWVSHGGDTNAVTLIPFTLPESLDILSVICPAFVSCNFGGVRIGEGMHLIFSPSNEGIYQFDPESGAIIKSYDVRHPENVIINGDYIWALNGSRSRTDFGHTLTKIVP